MFYSPSTRGFYSPKINKEIPSDAVEVSDIEYRALFAGQASGGLIEPGENGAPELRPLALEKPLSTVVTMRQARLALMNAGLLEAVEEAVAGLPGDAGKAARIDWEYATELRRDHPLVASLAATLGLSDDALNDLFRAASEVV